VPTDPEDIAFLLMGVKALDSAKDAKKLATLVGKNADLAVTVLKAVRSKFKGKLPAEAQFQLNLLINKISHLKNNKKAIEEFAERVIRECSSPSGPCGKISKSELLRLQNLFKGPGGERFLHKLVFDNNLGYAGQNLKLGTELGNKLLSSKKFDTANFKTERFTANKVNPSKFNSAEAQQRLQNAHQATKDKITKFLNEGLDLKRGTGYPNFNKYELTFVDFSGIERKFTPGKNSKLDFPFADELALTSLKQAHLLPTNAVKSDVAELRKELGLTWHHDEDLQTMRLVPTAIHASTNHHLGGAAGSDFVQNRDISKASYELFIEKQVPSYYN
jgi:hypothetical protein